MSWEERFQKIGDTHRKEMEEWKRRREQTQKAVEEIELRFGPLIERMAKSLGFNLKKWELQWYWYMPAKGRYIGFKFFEGEIKIEYNNNSSFSAVPEKEEVIYISNAEVSGVSTEEKLVQVVESWVKID